MNLTNAFIRFVFKPLCRTYARRLKADEPADGILTFLTAIHFWMIHGYWPHLKQPRTFEEKVNSRMLFDRNPLWTCFSDKLLVRDYVANKVGCECLIPLLWSGEEPEQIPFDTLPEKFVIKANHGCGYNIIVPDKSKLDRATAKCKLKKWLSENFCRDTWLGTSWAYKNIKPMIIVEAFIDDDGKVPLDYKFFCFGGRAEYLQMNFDRFGDAFEKTFDRDFNPLDLWQGTKQYPNSVPRPTNYYKMVALAETLSREFDFLRVDFYNIGGRIYLGELTCYPCAGSTRWIPEKWDFVLGEKWKFRIHPGSKC